MSAATSPSREELIERIHDLTWVHAIDLGSGIITPGSWGDHNPSIWKAMSEIDFRGKKVLDIGCWDGLWSFEAEKRGAAEVYATDYSSQRYTDRSTFVLASQILNSKAKYFPDLSVYRVEDLGVSDFDVVIFAGVYYHLKDPLKAFAGLRRVMKDGGLILVEGAILDEPVTVAQEHPRPGFGSRLARFFRATQAPSTQRTALSQDPEACYAKFYYRDSYLRDLSNWWVPTIPCLRQWVECNYFETEKEYEKWSDGQNPRAVITARAVRRKDPLYLYPDDDLSHYDLN